METEYTKCHKCYYPYSKELKECPKCNAPTLIQEELGDIEKTFNICDGE